MADRHLYYKKENKALKPFRIDTPYTGRFVLHIGRPFSEVADIVKHNSRLPVGHPEGFIEAFANIYRNAGRLMSARAAGVEPHPFDLDFPTVYDGTRGVHFIHKTMESGHRRTWVDARYVPEKS